MSERAAPILPGRLGNPDMTLADDPRADPRMIAALAPLGIGGPAEPLPLTPDMPLEHLHAFAGEAEQGFGGLGEALLVLQILAQGEKRDEAVERPAFEIVEVQGVRHPLGDRPLARGGGSVDRDDGDDHEVMLPKTWK